ncbi:MAG: hypothetical protein A2V88_14265 [Elusimicrobia bacterium RBG_16_66_12]|nr:MAG: hypothetical protein A2V88_14265 [Elusimicrobia bacterium RBG_16_66_12]
MATPNRFSRKMSAVLLAIPLSVSASKSAASQAIAPKIGALKVGAVVPAVGIGSIGLTPLGAAIAPTAAANLPVSALADGRELQARLEAPGGGEGAAQAASALDAFFSGSPAAAPDHVVTTPDGKWILTAKGGDVQSWDSQTRRLAWEFRGSREGKDGHRSYEVFQVSNDGTKLSMARSYTGDVWVLETGSGKVSNYLSARIDRGVEETVISQDGSLVGQSNFYGGEVLAEVGTGKIFLRLQHASGVSPHMRYRMIGFSPDNRWLEVIAYTKERRWDVSLLRLISRVPLIRRIPNLTTWVKDLFH